MLNYIIVCVFFVLVSCNPIHKQEAGRGHNELDFNMMAKDTLVTYDIEGISTEGTVANVNYVNGKITKSVINIYGETGQARILYKFDIDKIKVLETKYSYKMGIENVKSDEDMQIDYEIEYFIDFKGNLLGKEISDRIDIFKEFREVVPFELR
jgi:hypothetical protein